MLQKTTRINALFDFYKNLLTDKQKQYLQLYYLEDYSLGEISVKFNISRQAVHDNIKRTEQILEDYEEKLNLYKKFKNRLDLLNQLRFYIETKNSNHEKVLEILKQIEELD